MPMLRRPHGHHRDLRAVATAPRSTDGDLTCPGACVMTRHDSSVISPARPPSRDMITLVRVAISDGQGRLRLGGIWHLAVADHHQTDPTMGRPLCRAIASAASRPHRKPKSPYPIACGTAGRTCQAFVRLPAPQTLRRWGLSGLGLRTGEGNLRSGGRFALIKKSLEFLFVAGYLVLGRLRSAGY